MKKSGFCKIVDGPPVTNVHCRVVDKYVLYIGLHNTFNDVCYGQTAAIYRSIKDVRYGQAAAIYRSI